MDLKYKDSEVLIEGLELPNPFKISLSKRGKTVYNHMTVVLSKANDLYLQLFSIVQGEKKNTILSEIINEFRKENSINI